MKTVAVTYLTNLLNLILPGVFSWPVCNTLCCRTKPCDRVHISMHLDRSEIVRALF